MIVFNIQTYGDFDVASTAMIMIAPLGMSKKIAREIAKEATEILSKTNDPDSAVSYLDGWGCIVANTHDITIGGDL